jgi:hypothetical protein
LYKNTYKLLLLLVLGLVSQVPALSLADNVSEYTIKAAFIYNFARFTEWPDESDELKVCIYGEDPFGSSIDILNGKQSSGRTIKVIRTRSIDEVKSCHIAFLNIIPPVRRLFARALQDIEGANVLTVSDAEGVIDFGVMIGLKLDNDKVAFDVNHTVAKASNIEISAKLLRLAKVVN